MRKEYKILEFLLKDNHYRMELISNFRCSVEKAGVYSIFVLDAFNVSYF